MTSGQIVKLFLGIVLMAALGFLVYWGVTNKDTVSDALNGANIYTQEDVDTAYNKGYDEGAKGLAEQEQMIKDLRENITKYQSQIDSLNTNIYNLNATVTRLQNTNSEQAEDIATQTNLINELNEEKSELQRLIDEQQSELNEYIAKLEAIGVDLHKVIFAFDTNGENVHCVKLVENNAYINPNSVATPTITNRNFAGWSTNGSTLVDLATHPITADTIFIAIYEPFAGNGMFVCSNFDDERTLTVENDAIETVSYKTGSGFSAVTFNFIIINSNTSQYGISEAYKVNVLTQEKTERYTEFVYDFENDTWTFYGVNADDESIVMIFTR